MRGRQRSGNCSGHNERRKLLMMGVLDVTKVVNAAALRTHHPWRSIFLGSGKYAVSG